LLEHAGVKFLHLGCNPASQFPRVPLLFWWQGADGSRVLCGYTVDYGSSLTPPANWPAKNYLSMVMAGDNHGPPSPDDVEKMRRQLASSMPGVNVHFGTLDDFAKAILAEKPDLPVVRGDADLLGQLFQNLLSNALRFRADDAPPRIDIGATPEGTRWRFRVADNGIGVATEDRERIFELFTRLRPSAYPGTGTGLAVSRRIVERHGGQIHVEDNQPAGSVFSFTLSAEPRS